MGLLTKQRLVERINSGLEDQIFVDPLLSESQVGGVSVDLRLGTDFLVSVPGDEGYMSVDPAKTHTSPERFFQSVRRDLGDRFLVHPAQAVLATTLEYVGIPTNAFAEVVSRSSYQRLGLSITSTFQPGYRGCISLELFNLSNAPIELIVGSRVVQAKFIEIDGAVEYIEGGEDRKYLGNVRPTVSRASRDPELSRLVGLSAGRRV